MTVVTGTPRLLARVAERGLARGRAFWQGWQVGAALAIGQFWSADDRHRLREPYPIVRVADDAIDGFDPRERLNRLVLTEPLDLADKESQRVGMPGDAPN